MFNKKAPHLLGFWLCLNVIKLRIPVMSMLREISNILCSLNFGRCLVTWQ